MVTKLLIIDICDLSSQRGGDAENVGDGLPVLRVDTVHVYTARNPKRTQRANLAVADEIVSDESLRPHRIQDRRHFLQKLLPTPPSDRTRYSASPTD